MNRPVLLDTGPLVAVMNRRDQFHSWAQQEMAMLQPPLLTCEAILVEAWFLLGRVPNGRSSLLRFLNQSELRIGIQFAQEKDRLLELMQRYSSVPMSVADACLVRLSEKFPTGVVLTLDSDFLVYRRFDREPIPTIMPPPC
ncbi:PIN domain-containing protein [Limnothrix sp. FACHB-1083]|uniref:type II toxin-antitoxin system VapC family toxin n=1 Tax=unclassified Limnothrix TaxID=2632864 RepID=UPI001680BE2B|nr:MULTISPECIES: PIN domain-containing protein [unclassified Limnothrix]MBD2161685.1 PIN domain-containing protein [Limnothrix sp. FACHB-1083]MBD2192738.1 PIN domain-containing protein [Limnothrix sp. FACHB-1088]